MKEILGNDVCQSLPFLHAFTGCDTTSRIFGIGKKTVLKRLLLGDPVLRNCAKTFNTPAQHIDVIVNSGCAFMVSLFNGKPGKRPICHQTHWPLQEG